MESMVKDTHFWRGKKVFVTGHTGFKGSWLCLWLQKLGANVTGYALTPPTNPNLFEVANVSEGMASVIGNISDLNKLTQTMQNAEPEIVIHMAAQALVRESYLNPVENYLTNVMGTVHLFEAVRKTSSVRVVVNVTSDKCYENKEWYWGYRENEPLGGYDPYSSSKACAEIITSAWRNSYFNLKDFSKHKVAIGSARAGNVIGGGDWATDRLIPDIIRAISTDTSISIRNPKSIRPWQHVLEPLSGYLLLAENLYKHPEVFSEGWNFGPHDHDIQTVHWIVNRFKDLWTDKQINIVMDTSNQPHEACLLKLDCSKANSKLGWTPRTNLNWTIKKIVEWQKQFLDGADMKLHTLSQIKEFTDINDN